MQQQVRCVWGVGGWIGWGEGRQQHDPGPGCRARLGRNKCGRVGVLPRPLVSEMSGCRTSRHRLQIEPNHRCDRRCLTPTTHNGRAPEAVNGNAVHGGRLTGESRNAEARNQAVPLPGHLRPTGGRSPHTGGCTV